MPRGLTRKFRTRGKLCTRRRKSVPDKCFSYMTKFVYMTNGVYRLNPGADTVKCRTWGGHSGQAVRDDRRPRGASWPAGPIKRRPARPAGRWPSPARSESVTLGFPCPVKRSGADPRVSAPAFASASLIGPTRVHNPTCNGHRRRISPFLTRSNPVDAF
jgi:hypothetical protein